MNSIFVEICKQHLLNIIDTAIDGSSAADQSVQNKVLSYVGWERRPDLAEDKRQYLRSLRATIETYNPTVINDEAALKFFNEQLTLTRRTVITSSKEKDKPEGITGVALSKGLELIPAMIEQLRSTSLLNIPRDNKPLHIFQYYIAHYFATKVVNQIDATGLQQVAESIQLSNFKARERERERVILEIITDCKSAIDAFPLTLFNYETLVRRQITASIERLKTADTQLTTKYGQLLTTATFALSFFGGAQPDETLLINLLDKALADIIQTTPGMTKSPSGWDDISSDVQMLAKNNMIELENTERETITQSEQTAWVNIMRLLEQAPRQLCNTTSDADRVAASEEIIKEEENNNDRAPTITGEVKANLLEQLKSARATIWQLEKSERSDITESFKVCANL